MKRSIRLALLLMFVFAVFGAVHAMAAGLTQEQIDAMDSYVQEYMNKYQVPGMALSVVSNGQTVLTKGYGTYDVDRQAPVDIDTNFQIASVSKNFTALAILQLRDQGLLNLEDPVTKYLPWFASKDIERSNKITINHLVHHISGIPTTAYGLEVKGGTEDQLEEQVKRLNQISLTQEPGTRYQYSNLNYWTLALLVETLTGMKFSDYMVQNVFTPLEMDRTGYLKQVSDLGNLSVGYRMENGKHTYFDYTVPESTNAAGGVITNAEDFSHYMLALLNGGTYNGKEILKASTVHEMMYEGFIFREEPYRNRYCFGFMNFSSQWGPIVFHGGDNPNYTAELNFFPELGIGFALLSNSQHSITHDIAVDLGAIVFGNPATPIEMTGTENDQKLAGILSLAKYPFVVILVIWLMIVLLGARKGKYHFAKPGVIRLILQVILIPLGLLFAAYVVFNLPISVIGSLRIAQLYQPDMIKAVIVLVTTLVIFALFVAVMGFVKKVKPVKVDQATKTV